MTKEERQKKQEENKRIWRENADKWTEDTEKFVGKINKRKIGYYICCSVIPALVMVGCYFLYNALEGLLPSAITAVGLFLILLIYGRAVAKRGIEKLGIFSRRRMKKEIKQKYCLFEKILRGVGIALFVCALIAFAFFNVCPFGRRLIGNDPLLFGAIAAVVALGCLLGVCRPGFRKAAYCKRCGCCNSYYLTDVESREIGRKSGLYKTTGTETYTVGKIYSGSDYVGSIDSTYTTGYFYDKVTKEWIHTYDCKNCGYHRVKTERVTYEDKH